MILDQKTIDILLRNYIPFIEEISNEYDYDDNIKHLLYLVVPAFIAYYGIKSEPTVLKCFKNVKIYIREHNDNVKAAFNRSLRKNDEGYYTDKFITISPFTDSSLSTILDNLIHEFNHAINSVNNEIIVSDDLVKVRTGLTTLNYNKNDLSFIEKSSETVLEELLNTSQTEEIINTIKSFGDYDIKNIELSNSIYNIRKELGEEEYTSDAYKFQKKICIVLMNNKTFIPTANKLRLKGNIEEIPELFDKVIGKEGSYNKLNELLTEMYFEIIKYGNSKMFKNKSLNKIKSLTNEVSKLIIDYNNKCIFR